MEIYRLARGVGAEVPLAGTGGRQGLVGLGPEEQVLLSPGKPAAAPPPHPVVAPYRAPDEGVVIASPVQHRNPDLVEAATRIETLPIVVVDGWAIQS